MLCDMIQNSEDFSSYSTKSAHLISNASSHMCVCLREQEANKNKHFIVISV